MKKYAPLLSLLALGLTACPSPAVPPASNPDGSTISGKIDNWPAGKTGKISAPLLFGATTSAAVAVSADGSFSNLVLPTPAPADLSPVIAECASLATPSDGTLALVYPLTVQNTSGADAGLVLQANATQASFLAPANGSTIVLRYYVENDLKINGSCGGSGSITTNYNNVSFKKGWNVVLDSRSADGTSDTFSNGAISSDVKFSFYPSGTALNVTAIR